MTKNSLLVRPRPTGGWLGSIFNERDSFVNSFDQLFDEMLKAQFPDAFTEMGVNPIGRAAYPKVNVVANKNELIIEAELAGLSREDIEVDVKDTVISISGGKASSQETEEPQENNSESIYLIRELKRSKFSRSFILGKQFDSNKIDATFKNGLLTIKIPRFVKESSNPLKVTIK